MTPGTGQRSHDDFHGGRPRRRNDVLVALTAALVLFFAVLAWRLETGDHHEARHHHGIAPWFHGLHAVLAGVLLIGGGLLVFRIVSRQRRRAARRGRR